MNIDKINFKKIVENLGDGLYLVDRDRVITYWNKGAERITGFTADEVVGRSCSENILTHMNPEGTTLCNTICPMAKCMADEQPGEAELFLHHKEGHRIPISVRVNPLTDKAGRVIGGVELFTDISNRNTNELRLKELEKLVMLDPLTQLANRNYIQKEMEIRFAEKKRFNIPFGLLFMDIDHFKKVNDTYGHNIGDTVLKFVADTLVNNSRPFDIYGRWGGEEFIGILRNISLQDLERIGQRLRTLVENSYLIQDKKKLQVTISIGATLVDEDDTMESLMIRADQLLYESKRSGRNHLTLG
jgi:diguanylate cyclase (GGDEF)-like protein/PAS domain S-box-containing protein